MPPQPVPPASQRIARPAAPLDPAARARMAAHARERLAIMGLVLLSAGAGLIYRPAGLIVPGVYLLARSWPPRRPGGDHVAR